MLKHLYTFICNGTSLDANDGSLSAFSIIENVNVPAKAPDGTSLKEQFNNGIVAPLNFYCVTSWLITDAPAEPLGEIEFVKTIFNDSGEKIADITSPVTLNPEHNRFNIRELIAGLPLKGAGDYKFRVELKKSGKVIGKADYPFTVKQAD